MLDNDHIRVLVDLIITKQFTMPMLFVGEFEGIEQKLKLVEPKKELNGVMTDFVTNEFFPHATDSEQFIKLVFNTFNQALITYFKNKNINASDIFIVYKGGNILRYVAYEVMHELPGAVSDEIYNQYKDVFKKSDADFSIYINPKLAHYDDIFVDINTLSYLLQNQLRNEFMTNPSKYFNFYKLNMSEQLRILSTYVEKLNNTETIKNSLFEYNGKFINLVFNKTYTNEQIPYVAKPDFYTDYDYRPDSLYLIYTTNLQKLHQINSSIANLTNIMQAEKRIYSNIEQSPLMISSNQTLDFKKIDSRVKFSLVRTKVIFNAYFKKSIPDSVNQLELLAGELIDVSVPHRDDDTVSHYFENVKQNIDLYHIKTDTDDLSLSFIAPSIMYLTSDIERILYRDQIFPWDDTKYAKRIKRVLFFYFVLLLTDTKLSYDKKIAYLRDIHTTIIGPVIASIKNENNFTGPVIECLSSNKQENISKNIKIFLSDKNDPHIMYPFQTLIVSLQNMISRNESDIDSTKFTEYIMLINEQILFLIKLFELILKQKSLEGLDTHRITEGTVLYGGYYEKYLKYKYKYCNLKKQL